MSADVASALEVRNLSVVYRVRGIDREVIRDITLRVGRGESYGLVGESGCGKSTVAMALMRYLPRNGRVTGGRIMLDGVDIMAMREHEVRELRARRVSMVYQNPGAALNPSMRVGEQVAETFKVLGATGDEATDRARRMLERVQISDPGGVMRRYPHQLSGGMQQRAVIAMALASDPALLVLDEPTTGLDATVEAEVLDLVSKLRQEFGTAVLFISHSLAVIRKMCDRVGVLYAGRMVEESDSERLFAEPRHPYTVGLLRCIPQPGARKAAGRLDTIPGYLPAIGTWSGGCVFTDRCAMVQDICRAEEPALEPGPDGHASRCHFADRASSLPRHESTVLDTGPTEDAGTPLVHGRQLAKTYRQGGQEIRALADVDIDLWAGQTLGLVGESGSGKTTLARVLLGLTGPDEGSILELDGKALAPLVSKRDREQVRSVQIVFQNPDQALNRRHVVGRMLRRAIARLAGLTGDKADARLRRITSEVRLTERHLTVRPTALSGGLKQRVAIARAFAGSPRVVVCDEPTSALDVSVQAAILNLLADLQREEHVAYVFISHDLGVVRYLSDRIAVLYLGRLMEIGPAEAVFAPPHHPYTEALLSAVPRLDEDGRVRIRLEGDIPSHADPPSGCVFHTRCPRIILGLCDVQEPPLAEGEPGHALRCHRSLEELRELQKTAPPPRPEAAPSPDPV